MKIQNYVGFLLEEAEKNTGSSKSDLIESFFGALRSVLEDVDESSFSNFAALNSRALNSNAEEHDPDKDFKLIIDGLDKHGWKKDDVHNLFVKYGDSLVSAYGNGDSGSKNAPGGSGMADLFFYKMTHGKTLLSGINYKQATKDDPEELFVKYGYGYHKTKYGQLAIMQHFGSLEKWFEAVYKNFVELLCSNGEKSNGEEYHGNIGQELYDYAESQVRAREENTDMTHDWLKQAMKKACSYKDDVITINLKHFGEEFGRRQMAAFVSALNDQLESMGFKTSKKSYNSGGTVTINDDMTEATVDVAN